MTNEPSMEERFMREGAVSPERPRRGLPRFVRRMLAAIALVLGLIVLVSAITVGVALLIAAWQDLDAWTTVTYAFYIVGAILVALPFLGGIGDPGPGFDYITPEQGSMLGTYAAEARSLRHSFIVYVAVGLALVAIGFLLEVN
jgi:hypothetical protein